MPPAGSEAESDSLSEINELQNLFDYAEPASDEDSTESGKPDTSRPGIEILLQGRADKEEFIPPIIKMPGLTLSMRVEILSSLLEIPIKTEGRINLYELKGKDSTLITNIRGEFTLRRNGNTLEILHPGKKFWGSAKNTLVLKSQSPKNLISVNGLKYRGNMEVRLLKDGKLSVINHLGLEDYIKGVLPYEMPARDMAILEALKAQAVAARTYALTHQGQFRKKGFDVYADTRDQVYQGAKAETFLSNKAVEETYSVILKYKEELASCYYHSTCGGKTANLHQVWISQNPIPYLTSIADIDSTSHEPYCKKSKYIRWYEKWDRKKLAKIIKNNQSAAKIDRPQDFSRLMDLKIEKQTESGRVLTLKILTDKGPLTVHGDKTRWALKRDLYGSPILLSSWFTIKQQSDEIKIEGKGFGHGIGMCQMGAMERARRGANYQEILTTYYQGTEVFRLID